MKEALKPAREALRTTANPKAEEAIAAIKSALAQPTSGDYALGYAEGFNDACKPKPAQEPDHGDELTIAYMSGVLRGKELAAQQCLDCGSNNIGIPATYDSLIDSVKTSQASA